MAFTEQWLREHEARMAAVRTKVSAAAMNEDGINPVVVQAIQFTLARPFLLLNKTIRMHWANRRKYQQALADEIAVKCVGGYGQPMARARVTIIRYSLRVPDQDGLIGGAKQLIDCLLVKSDRHPHGLGFVVDDDPAHMELVVRAERVARRSEQRTEVTIRKI